MATNCFNKKTKIGELVVQEFCYLSDAEPGRILEAYHVDMTTWRIWTEDNTLFSPLIRIEI